MPSLSGWYCGHIAEQRRRRLAAVSMPSLSDWYCDRDGRMHESAGMQAFLCPRLSGWYCDEIQLKMALDVIRVSMPSLSGWYCDGAAIVAEVPRY